MSNLTMDIEALSGQTWKVSTERELDGRRATGVVIVRQELPPDPHDPPHGALAGARAWLALGEQMLREGQAAKAISSAQAGLDELGRE